MNGSLITFPAYPLDLARTSSRWEIEGTFTSKRKLLHLVKGGIVSGWDDPRLPTIRGVKRRGVRPEGLKKLVDMLGLTDSFSQVPMEKVEHCWRDDLESVSARRLVVLDPLKVEISTYAGSEAVELTDFRGQNAKDEPSCARSVTFSNEVYIDRSDFSEDAPEGYLRLSKIGSEVKLRGCYVIKLEEIVKDENGDVVSLKCSHDPETRDIMPARKPNVIHWVNAKDCVNAEVRLINSLFLPVPAGEDFTEKVGCLCWEKKGVQYYLNPEAWVVCAAKAEASLSHCKLHERFQFERCGYFAPDYDCLESEETLVFNRVVPLAESSGKRELEGNSGASRKEEQATREAKKELMARILPADLFKTTRGADFSEYDDKGLPTHDKDGKELSKSAVKKLQQELAQHAKVYTSARA